jgi:hypothetical protein
MGCKEQKEGENKAELWCFVCEKCNISLLEDCLVLPACLSTITIIQTTEMVCDAGRCVLISGKC